MSRSLKKGPYIDEKLLKKVFKARAEGKTDAVIKTWARDCTITPDMVGIKFGVHNGKDFITVFVTEDMVGHRLGEFSMTRKFKGHAKKGKISKIYAFSGRFLKDEL
ncbi:MAG: 30S ribosomal protein S19 [Candidatus Dojkabacteria bacterium]|nr:MAG: 30S ribosomal protein S19 [Candidatus Dojkabacteria bacterium]